MWRRAWVAGQNIVIDCVPEELERFHLKDLKEDVANTNRRYREALVELEREQKSAAEVENRERERLEALKKRLDFT